MTENFTTPTKSPYRFDTVGSFLRPQELKDARAAYKAGDISADDLKAVEDKAITDLVQKQEAAGLKAVTDGEFRRSWWHYDFFWGLNGVEADEIEDGVQFDAMPIRAEIATIKGKISGNDHPFVNHFKFTRSVASDAVEVKQTIPAPAQFIHESLRPENIEATRAVYATDEALVDAVAAAYQTVIQDLAEAGAKTIQFDDCSWNRIIGQSYEGFTPEQYEERKQLLVTANNKAIEGKPEGLVIATHVCRGNYRSTWRVSGGYESVATPLFDQENVEAYFLEYDSDRSGGFEPLKHVTPGKNVVLGLVTSKTGDLENKADVIARIHEAAKFVPLDNLFLSPQCGFSSTEEGNILTEEAQWKKIALIKEIAEEVWG